MNIGIIGAGHMGAALGKILAQNGHSVLFSFSEDPQKLTEAAQAAGPNAKSGTPAESAQFGEVLFLGVPFAALETALQQAGSLDGRIVITSVSPLKPDMEGRTTGLAAAMPISAAERIAELAPGAKVVETFNMTFAETLAADSRLINGEKPSLPYCGDDAAAKATVHKLIETCGYEALDFGPLIVARTLETLATAWFQVALAAKQFPDMNLKILRR